MGSKVVEKNVSVSNSEIKPEEEQPDHEVSSFSISSRSSSIIVSLFGLLVGGSCSAGHFQVKSQIFKTHVTSQTVYID